MFSFQSRSDPVTVLTVTYPDEQEFRQMIAAMYFELKFPKKKDLRVT